LEQSLGKIAQAKERKHAIGLMTDCNLTPAKNSWSITNCNSIVNRHECHQVLTALMPLLRHGQSQQRG
jgi:hypothetical protein